jgi:CHAT domain-containing protein
MDGKSAVGISTSSPALHYVPFAALTDPAGGYVIDKSPPIFYFDSGSLIYEALKERGLTARTGAPNFIALEDPDNNLFVIADNQSKRLASMYGANGRAGRCILEGPRAHIYSGDCATAANLRIALASTGKQQSAILHVLAHGDFTKNVPGSSINLHDQALAIGDIWSLDLQGLSLATLAVCNSGVGNWLGGDQMASMQEAFTYRGTGSVLASLWYVWTESTAAMTTRFYDIYRSGKVSKAAALRAAQIEMRDDPHHPDWAHPYFWAAFTLRGLWQ